MAFLLLPVGPGKNQQERALANCLQVVRYVAVERQQLSPGYFQGCTGEVEAYVTSEHQDGKPCTRLVLLETGPSFHRDQDNTEIRVLDECSGTATSILLPGLFLPHALYFIWNQYLQQRAPEVRSSLQTMR